MTIQNTEENTVKTFYFAGGGTGGHIYPALAVAQEIKSRVPQARIVFFCSDRPIDARILSETDFEYIALPAKPLGKTPKKLWLFLKTLRQSWKIAKETIHSNQNSIMITTGGFSSAPAAMAAQHHKMDIYMINVDAKPGKANKLLMKLAKKVFTQFEYTEKYCRGKAVLTGAPLRNAFKTQFVHNATAEKLGLSPKKKTLLITGASTGAVNINSVIGFLISKLESMSNDWQIIHLAGISNYDTVKTIYKNVKINHLVMDYCDNMAEILTFSDLVIGRAGAMSIAEFASTKTPTICLPYPYHQDKHQHINATQLEKTGCCRIVEDLCDTEKTSRLLWPVLSELAANPDILEKMALRCGSFAMPNATTTIADAVLY